jgi:hypothetical protein
MYICKVINNEKTRIMKTMSTIEELDIKMIKIAESVGMSIEKFKSLPRLKFMKICNEYNSKNK